MNVKIYSFIFTMWILMLVGGGLMTLIIGPFSLGSIVSLGNPSWVAAANRFADRVRPPLPLGTRLL